MTKKFGVALLASVVANGVAAAILNALIEYEEGKPNLLTNMIAFPMGVVYIASIAGTPISIIGVITSFLMDLGEKRGLSRS